MKAKILFQDRNTEQFKLCKSFTDNNNMELDMVYNTSILESDEDHSSFLAEQHADIPIVAPLSIFQNLRLLEKIAQKTTVFIVGGEAPLVLKRHRGQTPPIKKRKKKNQQVVSIRSNVHHNKVLYEHIREIALKIKNEKIRREFERSQDDERYHFDPDDIFVGYTEIRDRLNEKGIKTSRKKSFHTNTVRQAVLWLKEHLYPNIIADLSIYQQPSKKWR